MSGDQPPECPTCGKRRWPVTHSCTGIRPVTAPGGGGADEIREQLAAALPESLGPVGLRRRAIPALDVQGSVTGYGVALLDALLPTVQALIAKGAAAVAERVRAIHVPVHAYCVVCDRDRDVETLGNNPACEHRGSFCRECDHSWPCTTRRALDGTP